MSRPVQRRQIVGAHVDPERPLETVYVHAPYVINVCSPHNNIRYGSRKILQQTCEAAAEIGAAGAIVHAGTPRRRSPRAWAAGCARSRCSSRTCRS